MIINMTDFYNVQLLIIILWLIFICFTYLTTIYIIFNIHGVCFIYIQYTFIYIILILVTHITVLIR